MFILNFFVCLCCWILDGNIFGDASTATTTFNRGLGPVFLWGRNENSQLFLGDGVTDATLDRNVPVQATSSALPISPTQHITILLNAVSAGEKHTLILSGDGHVFSIGSNMQGQLGIGDYSDQKRLHFVNFTMTSNFLTVSTIGAGSFHSLCATDSGNLYVWGSNTFGQLGIGAATKRIVAPRMVKALTGIPISYVAGGYGHSIVISNAGVIYTFGANKYGQLGLGHTADQDLPQIVQDLSKFKAIRAAAGDYHSLVLLDSGDVYAWGLNSNGQCGSYNTTTLIRPNLVRKNEAGVFFVTGICAGSAHSVLVTDQGDAFSFGSNRWGQLGIDVMDSNPHPIPNRVPVLQKMRGITVYCGGYHNLAVTIGNTLYAWGWNKYGQLGVGDNIERRIPVPVSLTTNKTSSSATLNNFVIVHVAIGFSFTVVGTDTGDLSQCGYDLFGRYLCGSGVQLLPPYSS